MNIPIQQIRASLLFAISLIAISSSIAESPDKVTRTVDSDIDINDILLKSSTNISHGTEPTRRFNRCYHVIKSHIVELKISRFESQL